MKQGNGGVVLLDAGWPRVLGTMQGPGQRWWVSAYVTSAAELAPIRAGDNVLMQGEMRDFLRGASSVDAVENLLAMGIEIRRRPGLHAKMYARELDRGLAQVWVGSANLTHPGRSDGRWNANYEVMAGPLEMGPREVAELHALWATAARVDAKFLEDVRQAMREAPETGVSRYGNVLVVYIDLRLQSGAFTIPPSWFVDWAGWDGVATSVRYLTVETPFIRDWQAVRTAVLRGFGRWFGERTGARGEFVIEADDLAVVNTALSESRRFVGEISPLGDSEELDRALTAFIGRAMVVVRTQAKSRRLAEEENVIEQHLSDAFLKYVSAKSSRMAFTVLAPVSPPEGELLAAVRRLKSRPRSLFARDADTALDAFLGDLRSALPLASVAG